MLLKTILNSTLDFKSFVIKKCSFGDIVGETPSIKVEISPRVGSQPICSICGSRCPGYDTQPIRLYEHIPIWGYLVFFHYAPRRVNCRNCGVKIEKVPWSIGKSPITESYGWFLARWAKRMSWKEVAEAYRTTWHRVYVAARMAVNWGRENTCLDDITSIGIDEIKWSRERKFLTVVYQIDNHRKRLLWIGKGRSKKTLFDFFKWLGPEKTSCLNFVCSDMWQAFLAVVKQKVPDACHVLDRFHIVALLQKAIDKVRAQDARDLKTKGEMPILKHSRWVLLKKPEKLNEKQGQKLAELLKSNLKTVKSYLLKESFNQLWEYVSPYWAGKFIDRWTRKVMYSKIEPMKKVARTIRKHKPLILNYFKAKKTISQGAVEGFNNKAKLTFRKAYGFRSLKIAEIQLYLAIGDLPTPKFTHSFF